MDEIFKGSLFRAMDTALIGRGEKFDLRRCLQLLALESKAKATERFGLAFLSLALLCAIFADYVARVGGVGVSLLMWCTCLAAVGIGSTTFLRGNRKARACSDELFALACTVATTDADPRSTSRELLARSASS
jgi:hypothetical protein